ncbi:MAG: XdhC family protein [Lachnospiraceae bacterium]|jgi:xanthine dehydrogenase accessory factor|nr:XdhC family protein [Lachnospiraceae bacterium]
MQEVQKDIENWLHRGLTVALVQVIHTQGPSPRKAGSVMAVASDGSLSGSVSGGCLEGSMVQAALRCLEEGVRGIESYHGAADGTLEAGLACGSSMEAVVSMLQPSLFYAERDEANRGNGYVRVTLTEAADDTKVSDPDFLMLRGAVRGDGLSGGETASGKWHLVFDRWQEEYEDIMREAAGEIEQKLKAREAVCCSMSPVLSDAAERQEVTVRGYRFFYHYVKPKPKLICIGGVHIAVHLTRMAKELGYRTVVIDPRGAFSTEERFPFVDELWKEWPQQALKHVIPDQATALCALSHDPKFDVPAMAEALRSQAFYIGCLGRTTTQLDRCEALRKEGFTKEELARIYGPVGLNLGGREPAEIALSILSEITMVRYGGKLPTRTMVQSAEIGAAEKEKSGRR